MNTEWWRYFKRSAGLYGLFLMPTVLLILYAGQSDASISRHIDAAWSAAFWHFPGLGALPSRVLVDILTAISVLALGWLFYRGWRNLAQMPIPDQPQASQPLERAVMTWVAVCGAILLLVAPFHSSDLYGYLNRGFQQSAYGTNPYLTPIVYIPNWQQEPLFHPHWIYNPCPYGFFFAQLTKILTGLWGRSFVGAFLTFKVLNLGLLLGVTALILKLGRQFGLRRPWLAAYTFGANPLVLLNVMGNGHNDILMVALLMVSLWALSSDRWRWSALPLLLLSVLVKYASLLAGPFMLLYLWQRRDYKALFVGTIVSLCLLMGLGALYIDPSQPWPWADMLDNAGKPQYSPVDMIAQAIYYPVKWFHGPAADVRALAYKVMKPLFWLGFVLFYFRQIWLFARQKANLEQVALFVGLSITVMVALVSAKFHPWYVVMFLPVLLVLPEDNRWRQFGQTLALFQIASFTIFQHLPVFSPLVLTIVPLVLAFRGKTPFKALPQA